MGTKRSGSTLSSLMLWLTVSGLWAQNPPANVSVPTGSVSASRTAHASILQGAGSAPDKSLDKVSPALKLTLDSFLALVHGANRHLSERDVNQLAIEMTSPPTGLGLDPLEQQLMHGKASSSDRIDSIARGKFYECLEDQMLADIDERALRDAKLFVARTQQLEGNLQAPHSDVIKAELTSEQLEEQASLSAHRLTSCQRGMSVILTRDSTTAYDLATTPPRPVLERDVFLRRAAHAYPALSAHLTADTAAGDQDLSFLDRLLLSKILEMYDQAVFDRGEVDRLQSICDDAMKNQRLIQDRYRGGEASIYDVKAALDLTITAKDAWVRASVRALRSLDEVDQLLGKRD
jgi:hypothetical protein